VAGVEVVPAPSTAVGPAATEFYYRALVKLYAQAERRLELTIANADAHELVQHLEAGESTAQVRIFAGYIDRLMRLDACARLCAMSSKTARTRPTRRPRAPQNVVHTEGKRAVLLTILKNGDPRLWT
jgi:hypothetical protein